MLLALGLLGRGSQVAGVNRGGGDNSGGGDGAGGGASNEGL